VVNLLPVQLYSLTIENVGLVTGSVAPKQAQSNFMSVVLPAPYHRKKKNTAVSSK